MTMRVEVLGGEATRSGGVGGTVRHSEQARADLRHVRQSRWHNLSRETFSGRFSIIATALLVLSVALVFGAVFWMI
jgi:hypothetical protein